MKAKALKGKDFMVFVDGEAIALATSHELGLDADTTDAASKDDGSWDESTVTKKRWEVNCNSLVSADKNVNSFNALYKKWVAGEPVDIISGIPGNASEDGVPNEGWQVPGDSYFTGKALITSLRRNDNNGENSSMTSAFKGVGKLDLVENEQE